MFVLAGLAGLLQAISKSDTSLVLGYCILILVLTIVMWKAWHFGHRLNDIELST
jgi:hypothetical protein